MKIAIVNDMSMAAEALQRVIEKSGEDEVLWVARTGLDAIALCAANRPDLILMDLIMPDMDGIEATRMIMQNTPCAILIVTATPENNIGHVFRAMGAGALDVTATPVLAGDHDSGAQLLVKIRTIGKLIRAEINANQRLLNDQQHRGEPDKLDGIHTLVAIGASTGGPVALARILSDLRPAKGTAIVVVQHIDQRFADSFAKWLATETDMPVEVIAEGSPLRPDVIQIAKTNDHLILDLHHRFRYRGAPLDYAYRPSVNEFFQSVAKNWHRKVVGVLLTGMGRDGAEGLLALRVAGHFTIAQDQATSAVYGMPRAAAELNAAQMILPLDKIASMLRQTTMSSTGLPRSANATNGIKVAGENGK